MKSRSLLSFLALAVAAVSPALAAEVPSTLTETLAQLERIETQVLAAREGGQVERVAELREELRQLPVPAAEAVRASRIWALSLDAVGAGVELDYEPSEPDQGGGPKTGVWSLDMSILAATSVDEGLPHPPPVKGNYWRLDLFDSATTTREEPEVPPVKGGYWDPEDFELAPQAEVQRP